LDRELVVFFDEADCLSGASLITFLRQIRQGYIDRYISDDSKFPRSMALVGMRDIRDYLTHVRPDAESKGLAGPFNIKEDSLTLANFTEKEIGLLYRQHTDATGQIFEDSAITKAWYWTEGQPWLVNALAKFTVVKELKNDYSVKITGEHIDQAAQTLMLNNDTHFDSLKERLKEPRIRRVIESVLVGVSSFPEGISDDDAQYTLDLGLLKTDPNNSNVYLPANPINQEVIIRSLTTKIQRTVETTIPDSYKNKWMDGINLDMNGLLQAFQIYWSENSEMYIKNNMIDSLITNSIGFALEKYSLSDKNSIINDIVESITNNLVNLTNEALTHLVLFAFLQRVMNGNADLLQREYALGTQRVDICVVYKERRYPIELKIKGNKSHNESLEQLFGYMSKSTAPEGWLVVFDKDFTKPWDEKIFVKTEIYKNKTVHVFGC
jgi:hypothetical protein